MSVIFALKNVDLPCTFLEIRIFSDGSLLS